MNLGTVITHYSLPYTHAYTHLTELCIRTGKAIPLTSTLVGGERNCGTREAGGLSMQASLCCVHEDTLPCSLVNRSSVRHPSYLVASTCAVPNNLMHDTIWLPAY